MATIKHTHSRPNKTHLQAKRGPPANNLVSAMQLNTEHLLVQLQSTEVFL